MFDMTPQFLYRVYKDILSDYRSDIESKKWKSQTIESIDKQTGEVTELPLYVFEPKNIGERMSIDDKAIGHEGFTIFSNGETSKIALMIERTKNEDVQNALSLFGDKLKNIKSVSSDMEAGYLLAVSEQIPQAQRVIDKFHLMKYACDVPLSIKNAIRNNLRSKLSKGKKKIRKRQTYTQRIRTFTTLPLSTYSVV
jgi:transposase